MTKTLKIVFQMSCRNTFGLQTRACFCLGRQSNRKMSNSQSTFLMPVGWLSSVWDQQYEDLEHVI